mgnify:CR=1 FL=1
MRIARTNCASKAVCGILSADQKRSYFLTSYVKLARMEPEKFHGRAGETGMRQFGRIPFAVLSRAISGPHSESWQGMRPLILRCEIMNRGRGKDKIRMKTLIRELVVAIMVAGVLGLVGCQALESAKNSVVASVSAMRLKSDIEDECLKYESKNDGVGLKAYLTKLQNTTPKPDGWDSTLDVLVENWMAKAATMLLKTETQRTCDNFIAQGDAVGAKSYLNGLLAMDKKPTGWNDSVEALVNSLLAMVREAVLKSQCERIWNEVKVALDKRDFATARKLTSMANPFADDELRNDILKYRIGILNEIVNPYQCDWIIHQMGLKVAELRKNGQENGVKAYLASVESIKDEFPSIDQKTKEISQGLKNLYWLDDRVRGYVEMHIAQAREILDARAVLGNYRDYKEVFDLVDAAVVEMKLYNPNWGEFEKRWEASMKSVRRVMTTAEVNAKIAKAKCELAGDAKLKGGK